MEQNKTDTEIIEELLVKLPYLILKLDQMLIEKLRIWRLVNRLNKSEILQNLRDIDIFINTITM